MQLMINWDQSTTDLKVLTSVLNCKVFVSVLNLSCWLFTYKLCLYASFCDTWSDENNKVYRPKSTLQNNAFRCATPQVKNL